MIFSSQLHDQTRFPNSQFGIIEIFKHVFLDFFKTSFFSKCVLLRSCIMSDSNPKDLFWNPDCPLNERLDNLMSLLTLEEKIRFLYHIADDIPRLNISHYYHGNEALHGVVRPGKGEEPC